ncbi:IclR family transcriptional regulator domain-containing protein [Streptomyces sp. NPDC003703]|uniref:IclR family transcriptional regulator domain-containing protein n=1 Tax=Streptomyces sp. NPDC003283 TaxID=3364681 RepID=UPI0036BF2940
MCATPATSPTPPAAPAHPMTSARAPESGTAAGAPDRPHGPPPEAVAPLIRGVAVLRALTEAGGTLSPSALERATGLARATVDRVTATLARMGYVRLTGRDTVLAPRLMELGNACLAALRLPDLLGARADALADALDESVSLAVRDQDGIRFIHQATRRRAMSLSFRIGDLLPAERTAPGPLFATEWTAGDWHRWHGRRAADPENRSFPAIPPHPPGPDAPRSGFEERTARAAREGWAADDQLIEPGLVAVSVPVRDPVTGTITCAASVVSHTSRHSAEHLRATLLPRLRETVAAMEEDLRAASARARARTSGAAPAPAGAAAAAAAARPDAAPPELAAWTAASKQELGRGFIESLARGLTVLTAFGEDRPALTLTEVAQATGLARATARRALITHEHLGLVAPGPGRTFTLTPRVLSLGFPPLSRTSLPRIAQPHLEDLAAEVRESTALAVLAPGGEEIQYAARASTHHIMSVDLPVGTRLPARATALGRALTGPGPAGYALADEELEAGLRALAVPVHDRTGRPVAAVDIALHAARRTREECVSALLPALRRTAARIEADLRTATRFTRVPLT